MVELVNKIKCNISSILFFKQINYSLGRGKKKNSPVIKGPKSPNRRGKFHAGVLGTIR